MPRPLPERGPWLFAAALVLLCCGVIAAVISGAVGSRRSPPPLPLRAGTPRPAASILDPRTGRLVYVSDTGPATPARIVADPPPSGRAMAIAGHRGARGGGRPGLGSVSGSAGAPDPARPRRLNLSSSGGLDPLQVPISQKWMEGFYPIYEQAQRAFGVNWLLIASIHRQESAFSTALTTYHGLNSAGCCGGPMQFNVKDGPVSTWQQVAYSYRHGHRPAHYDHRTGRHPSIYDDFDSIMAAAHLLALDGAGLALNDSAWWAAYDYYGHDAHGVLYADQVLARAIAWSQRGFCVNCARGGRLLGAVQAAYGAPVMAQLLSAARARAARRRQPRSRLR